MTMQWSMNLANYCSGYDQKAYDDLMGLTLTNKMENPWKLGQLAKIYSTAMRHNINRKQMDP